MAPERLRGLASHRVGLRFCRHPLLRLLRRTQPQKNCAAGGGHSDAMSAKPGSWLCVTESPRTSDLPWQQVSGSGINRPC